MSRRGLRPKIPPPNLVDLVERKIKSINALHSTVDVVTMRRLCTRYSTVGYLGVGVEIGSFRGGSAAWFGTVAKIMRFSPFVCVDTWEGSGRTSNDHGATQDNIEGYGKGKDDRIYSDFQRVIREAGLDEHTTILKGKSYAVANRVDKHVSFLFIDGSHFYDDVLMDIQTWVPKITAGGIIAFDDYGPWSGTGGPEQAIEKEILSRPHHFARIVDPPIALGTRCNTVCFSVTQQWDGRPLY